MDNGNDRSPPAQVARPAGLHDRKLRYLRQIARAILIALASLSTNPFVPVASATTVIEGSIFEDLENADLVLVAHIDAIGSEDRESVPFARYSLSEIDIIKGGPVAPDHLSLAGGVSSSGRHLTIDGIPTFAVGDDLVVFLRFDNSLCPIIGGTVRTFRLAPIEGRARDEWRVLGYGGEPIMDLREDRVHRGTPAERARALTLDQFKRDLARMQARRTFLDNSTQAAGQR